MDTDIDAGEYRRTLVPEIVDEVTFEQTTSYVAHYRELTQDRIASVLKGIKHELDQFDVQD